MTGILIASILSFKDVILVDNTFTSDDTFPISLDTVVAKLGSFPNAVASSFNVLSVSGAASINVAIVFSTSVEHRDVPIQ